MPSGRKQPPGALEQALIDVIRARMVATGIRQTALAGAAGISDAQMSRIINGSKPMTVTELARVAGKLDTTTADLVAEAEAVLEEPPDGGDDEAAERHGRREDYASSIAAGG